MPDRAHARAARSTTYLARGPARARAAARRAPGRRATPVFLNARGGRLTRQGCWQIVRDRGRPGRARRAGSRRTCCGTRARPTCSTTAPTSGWSRSCSATPASRPRRCTRRCRRSGCARSTSRPSPGPDRGGPAVGCRAMPETTDAARRAQLTEEREHAAAPSSRHRTRARDVSRRASSAARTTASSTFDEGFADSGQVTAERGEVDALVGEPARRRSARSTTRSAKSTPAPTGSASVRRADRRGPARGDAGGPPLHHLRVAAPVDRVWAVEQTVILLRLPGRRGHPPRDQPRRRRALVRRRHREAGRAPDAQPDPAHRPVRVDHPARDGRARRAPGDRLGQAGAGEPEPAAQPAPRHAASWASPGPATNFVAHGRSPRVVARWLFHSGSAVASARRSTRLPARRSRSSSRSRSSNLFLGLFNLLPIPPLDGSALLERVLPEQLAARTGTGSGRTGCSVLFAARVLHPASSARSSARSTNALVQLRRAE